MDVHFVLLVRRLKDEVTFPIEHGSFAFERRVVVPHIQDDVVRLLPSIFLHILWDDSAISWGVLTKETALAYQVTITISDMVVGPVAHIDSMTDISDGMPVIDKPSLKVVQYCRTVVQDAVGQGLDLSPLWIDE